MSHQRPADPADVTTEDAIVKALYASVSFVPGQQPDYDRLRTLLHPEARLVPPKGELGEEIVLYDVESFITRSREHVVISGLERGGYSQREIARQSHTFGTILHLFSTFEAHPSANGAPTRQRGMNSIQLVKEGGRWWVVTILWDVEGPGNPLPPRYLG